VGDANEKPQVDPLKPFPALSMPPEAEQSLLRHTLNATLRFSFMWYSYNSTWCCHIKTSYFFFSMNNNMDSIDQMRRNYKIILRHKMQLADHDLKKLDGVRKILEEGFQREENNAEASLIRRSLEVHLQQKMDSAQKSPFFFHAICL